MKLDKASYEQYFEGFFLIDCVVRKKDILYFVLEEEYDEEKNSPEKNKIRTRIITCIDRPNVQPWGHATFFGMQRFQGGVSLVPKEQFVGVSLNDHVFALGSGDNNLEKDLMGGLVEGGKHIGMRGGVSKLRTIDGNLWLAGSGRTVGRRLGPDSWEWHDVIPYKSLMDDGGFTDIDGFSGAEIYAVGGHGDVWHYDGKTWRNVSFPSNMTLETICCAGDGYVYIGAEQGSVFKGRNNEWKHIYKGEMALPFRDMVWYQNKVWCTSDYGLWTIKNDKLTEADVPSFVHSCAGHLSVGDGMMLLTGIHGAVMHDGIKWHNIIDYDDLA
ncbi:MAG TPA: hypothetical protein VF800_05285 [Telluria sp.]|jgi:hypothetical protein